MKAELKHKLNNADKAEHGGVYDYINAAGDYRGLCIVVSGDHRGWDKYVSVISLSPCNRDEGLHNDEIGLRLPDGKEFWVHCGMVTYMRRDRLGEMVHKVSEQTIRRINAGIKIELGLSEKDAPDYEKMYRDLIKTIAGWNKIKEDTANG